MKWFSYMLFLFALYFDNVIYHYTLASARKMKIFHCFCVVYFKIALKSGMIFYALVNSIIKPIFWNFTFTFIFSSCLQLRKKFFSRIFYVLGEFFNIPLRKIFFRSLTLLERSGSTVCQKKKFVISDIFF